MADSLYNKLAKSYSPTHPLAQRNNLSLKEERTIYKLQFDKKRDCVSYRIDGQIISSGPKCDYLVLAKDNDKNAELWKAIFVELKGTDVAWALKQLDETMKNNIFIHSSVNKRYARIVAKSFPSNKSDPTYEKAKRDFLKRHNCNLRQVCSGQPDRID